MPLWLIILQIFIFIGAIVFALWKNFLPRRFTLFGVKYGDKFKDMNSFLKKKVVFVYAMTILFAAANILVPWQTYYVYYTSIKHRFFYMLIFIACIILWIVALTRSNIAKKYYEKEIREILDKTPLYMAVVDKLKKSRTDRSGVLQPYHVYESVVALKDGIALFHRRYNSYYFTNTIGGTTRSECVAQRDAWQRKMDHEWSSVHNLTSASVIFPAVEYGYEELSEQDKKDFVYYLSREPELDLVKKDLQFTEEFECSYTIVTTYESGRTEDKDKRHSATGTILLHAALSREDKKKKKKKK